MKKYLYFSTFGDIMKEKDIMHVKVLYYILSEEDHSSFFNLQHLIYETLGKHELVLVFISRRLRSKMDYKGVKVQRT